MSVGSRDLRIDLIRGVSILLVLVHHFNIAYRLNDTLLSKTLGWEAVRALARNGNYGVTMFFVVSGHLIASNSIRRWGGLANIDAKAFYGLRAARILPCLLLLLAVVNAFALGGVAMFQNRAANGAPLSLGLVDLACLTFWMNALVIEHGWVNYPLGVLWSLSVEEVFYISFPLVCLVLKREARLVAFLAVVVLVGPFYRHASQGDAEGFLYAYLSCFDAIAMGCCTALLVSRGAGSVSLRTANLVRAGVVAGMAALYLSWPIGESNVLGVSAMAAGTAVLIGVRSPVSGRRGGPAAATGPLAWFGRLSYELYLFHLVVLAVMRTVFPPREITGDGKLALLAVFLIVSCAVGAVIARGFSEPLNRRLRRSPLF